MVYRRRYFPALTITTISYAEKSITAEKLADGAVIHPKVAPDAIDSERVIDESLKSVDIKDGEIKTPDIQDGAVTTPKIAPAAVTPEKLSVSVLTRPVTPGVTSAEIGALAVTAGKLAALAVETTKIAAGAVTAAKLAGDAVETAKIKDANVTLAKMAPDSIDNTVIKANTIRGTEIAAGACGESEIGTDAIVTVKVKDRNITSPKIAIDGIIPENIQALAVTEPKLQSAALGRRHLESLRVRQEEFRDEFYPPTLLDQWVNTADAGGLISFVSEGLKLATGGVIGNKNRIDQSGIHWHGDALTSLPTLNIGVGYATDNVYHIYILGLYHDAINYIAFYSEELAGNPSTWKARCIKGGVSTIVDTGIAIAPAAGKTRLLAIDVLAADSVKFYVDGVEKAHITDAQYIMDEPYDCRLSIETKHGASKSIRLAFVSLLATREPFV